jgi:hypothetical protein
VEERVEELWRTLTYNRTTEGLVALKEWSDAFSVLIHGPAGVSMGPTDEASNDSVIENAMSFIAAFPEAIELLTESGRWLFMTESGRLGIANPNARVGDLICVVLGCHMPIAVRPFRKATADRTLANTHGSACLHGYMDGKAIDH